jgi:hypothetical protein
LSRIAILGIGITLVAITVSVPVYIYLSAPSNVPVRLVGDLDNDGVPDNEDFYDLGNGGIRIEIRDFQGECGNWLEPCEAGLKLLVDDDLDGSYEHVRERSLGDANAVQEVLTGDFDIPETATIIRFRIEVIDHNSLVGGDHVDYLSGTSDRWGYFEVDLTRGHFSWEGSGDDLPHCSFKIMAEVVGI